MTSCDPYHPNTGRWKVLIPAGIFICTLTLQNTTMPALLLDAKKYGGSTTNPHKKFYY